MRKTLSLGAVLILSPFLASCAANTSGDAARGDSGDPRKLSVVSTDDGCQVSATTAPAGSLTFDFTNDGSQASEFYLMAQDGQRVVAEVENVGPSLSRQLVVEVPEGTYTTACKPGMTGDGIRAAFDVTAATDGG